MNLWEEHKPLLILAGPTAVGKTGTSIALAKALDGECISADSVQVYKGLDIGSGKVKEEEKEGVPHHLLDILNPSENYDASLFQKMAREKIAELYSREKLPILVGGTGFYIQAMLYDIDFQEENQEEKDRIRRELTERLEKEGTIPLHQELSQVDPEAAEAIHENNKQRIIRALEYYYLHKCPISRHNQEEQKKDSLYDALFIVLCREREKLYQGIHDRVLQMKEEGLFQEVKVLYEQGYRENMPGCNAIGYKEVFAYLEGRYTEEECIEKIQQHSRNYAKRQMTWFRREKNTIFLSEEDFAGGKEERIEWIIKESMKKWAFLRK